MYRQGRGIVGKLLAKEQRSDRRTSELWPLEATGGQKAFGLLQALPVIFTAFINLAIMFRHDFSGGCPLEPFLLMSHSIFIITKTCQVKGAGASQKTAEGRLLASFYN